MRTVRDHYLPPDRDAFVAAQPPTGRIIVIAPTRAACETIELAMGLHIDTLLEREHGAEIRTLAVAQQGFGIVAGTGTGKTLAIRPIAETIQETTDLRVGVVNREREATPETPSWNVVIVTTGIARRWFQDGDIVQRDTLIVDEIHQTSAELELCLALGKRVGCRFIWLSATVDPTFYARYLDSAAVLETTAFDPTKRAKVRVIRRKPLEFLDERFLGQVQREKRGVGVFLPTRASVEEVASIVERRYPRIETAFYHGGEPIRVIRRFLENAVRKPYLLAMTAAGQSALNVQGLDTVVIDDTRFANIIENGKNVLTRLHLGANEILQMAGRVHGRVEGGRVFILSDRDIDFDRLQPTEPEFQLAGDSERVALTCAALGVRADELDLPVPLDRVAYRDALRRLESRGIVHEGRLTVYGRAVEAMPVDRPWAELLVHADDALVPYVAVMAAIESLHRMTREDRNLEGLIVPGSDHLTAYNLYADAYADCGSVGEVYGLPRHVFDDAGIEEWAEWRGALVKAIEDAALGMASVYRSLELPLPATLPVATDATYRAFADLVARVMPFDLVIDEMTATGEEARVSKSSVCGSWGAVAGTLRYFADRFGIPRAAIEGTQIPYDLVRKYVTYGAPEVVYAPERKRHPLVLRRRVDYFGFELSRDEQPIEEWSPELLPSIRHALADALARAEARHPAVKSNRAAIEQVREVYRRSGGITRRLGLAELTALYEDRLADVHSMDEFRSAALDIQADALVPAEERARWMALPSTTEVRGVEIPIGYDVEDGTGGVARLRLPEKMARTLVEDELPTLDRPLRFVVTRGQRGAVRAATLDELQELLDRPWSPEEVERTEGEADDRARRGRKHGRARGPRGARSARGTRSARGAPGARRAGGGDGGDGSRGGRDGRGKRSSRRGRGRRGAR
ncbi:MAG TPA: DEAD/DEAH box helicase [Gemmatimonadaceae bacterium]|nr:DEAD/DEAH box helicase [Gemmatimonadaceae bacterium]